jgi:hypothetical protein
MPTRYDELYRQSQLTNQNTRQPIMGAAGGGTTLMGGANPAMMAGVAQGAASMIQPTTSLGIFNWLRPQQEQQPLSTPADLNQEAAFTGKTMREIYEEARTAELSNLEAFRDTQRQMAARQGSSMYEQAQMAMSQRQLMSDARGLSGGAQEFAERGLGAQEQMVLAQIKNSTVDQLMQIDAQSLQDSNVATEVGLRAMQLEEQLNPQFRELAEIRRAADMAFQMGDQDEYSRLLSAYFQGTDQAYGTNLSNVVTSSSYDSAALTQTLRELQNPQGFWSRAIGIGAPALGTYVTGSSITGALASGTGLMSKILVGTKLATIGTAGVTTVGGASLMTAAGGLSLTPVGWAILGVAAVAAIGYTAYKIYQNRDIFWTEERRNSEIQKALNDARREMQQEGYDPQFIENIVRESKDLAKLPPKASNW